MSLRSMSFRVMLFFVLAAAVQAKEPAVAPTSDEALGRSVSRAKIVSTRVVAELEARMSLSDLVAFDGQLFVMFLDQDDRESNGSCIRVMSSKDGTTWRTAARLRSQEQGRGFLHHQQSGEYVRYGTPEFNVVNNKRLAIQARNRLPGKVPDNKHHVVRWTSTNGSDWDYEGRVDIGYYFGRPTWGTDAAYCYKYGTGCGSASTMEIWRSKDGNSYTKHYQQTFDNMPRDAALFFVDGTAHCLLAKCGFAARYKMVGGAIQVVEESPTGKSTFDGAVFGSATYPYLDWEWKPVGTNLTSPNVIHVPGKGTFATVEIRSEPRRVALCRLDLDSGRLTQLAQFGDLRQRQMGASARLPESEKHMPIGLAAHGGHLWVSYADSNAVKVVKIALGG